MKLLRLNKKLSWMALGLVVLLFSGLKVYAEEFKLGYINSIKIRAEYKEFADAQAKFDKEIAEFQS